MKIRDKDKGRYEIILQYILKKYPQLNEDIVLQDCFAVINADDDTSVDSSLIKAYTALLRLDILKIRNRNEKALSEFKKYYGKNN